MIGIYLLTWSGTDKVYIGQSVDIYKRYKQHVYQITTSKSNYKMLDISKTNGMPVLNVLVECGIEELDALEMYYIKEFDSIANGVNIAKGGVNAIGINNFASKYSANTILKIFSMLYRTNNTHFSIAKRLGINTSIVAAISIGERHAWLQEKYPEKYADMLHKNRVFSTEYPQLKDVAGTLYNVTNVARFCKEHIGKGLLPAHIGAVLRGDRKSHKGFTLIGAPKPKKKYKELLDPNGVVHVINNITEFCKNNEILQNNANARKGISRVLNEERDQYLGFRINNTKAIDV